MLQGRYAGKKAVIVKPFDDGNTSSSRKYGHALVCGLAKPPRRVLKSKSQKKQARAKSMKVFVKMVNYQHMMPTRYSLQDVDLKQIVTAEIFDKENVTKKKEARKEARKVLQETFEAGKSKWFFTKLRF